MKLIYFLPLMLAVVILLVLSSLSVPIAAFKVNDSSGSELHP